MSDPKTGERRRLKKLVWIDGDETNLA